MKLAETPWGNFHYWDNDCIGQAIASGAFWDEHLKPAFDEVQPGTTVVDVGANIGWFTVYAAKRGCHVMAFEPSPEVFELLMRNIVCNRLEGQVHAHRQALYERQAMLTLLPLGPDNPARQVLVDGLIDTDQCANSGSMALAVGEGSRYDDYALPLDHFDLTNVSLIKVDTEGCDLAVLKGARDTIAGNRPLLAFEYLAGGPPVEKYEQLMKEWNYEAVVALENMDGAHRDYIARPR